MSEVPPHLQAAIDAALRVARTPLAGVDMTTPIARAIYSLTNELAKLGLVEPSNSVKKAGERWKERAMAVVKRLCKERDEFTIDDVRAALPEPPTDPRALGGVMVSAQGRQWCERSGRFVPSKQARNHNRPVPVWRSRLRM